MNELDEQIKKLIAAGATDEDIRLHIQQYKVAHTSIEASAPVAQSIPAAKSSDSFTDLGNIAGASGAGTVASFLETLDKGTRKLEGIGIPRGGVFEKGANFFRGREKEMSAQVQPLAEDTGLNAKFNRGVAEFGGSAVAQLPMGMGIAKLVNPAMAPIASKLLGGVAAKASSIFATEAAKKAIEVGITTLPQELVGGMVAEGLLHPEALQDVKSIARTLAFSSIGSAFNMAGAYSFAIKNAKTPAELGSLREQVEHVFNADNLTVSEYKPRGRSVIQSPTTESMFGQQGSDIMLDPLMQRATGEVLPVGYRIGQPKNMGDLLTAESPNNLPTATNLANKRVLQILQDDINIRLERLKDLGPDAKPEPFTRSQTQVALESDPIYQAYLQHIEGDLRAQSKVIGAGTGGKGADNKATQFSPNLLAGTPSADALKGNIWLTVDELRGYLNILNMRMAFVTKSSDKSWMASAKEGTSQHSGIAFANLGSVMNRLDLAASKGLKTLSPEETKQIADDMYAITSKLSRGFEVPYKSTGLRRPGALRKGVTQNVAGSDLSTSAKLNSDIDISELIDDRVKRWVTGSEDAPPPVTPAARAQAQQSATNLAELVREAKIDYTPPKGGFGERLWYKVTNAKQEYYDRTWGVGKYSSEARDQLSQLSGISAQAKTFLEEKVSRIKLDDDGKWTGKREELSVRPINKIIDSFESDDIPTFDAVLKARVKIENPTLEIGKDLTWAENVMAAASPKFLQAADEFKQNMDVLVDDAVALGQLTPLVGTRMKSTFYASMARKFNENMTSNPFVSRKGSMKDTKSPLLMAQNNVFKWYETIHKNRAYNILIDDFEKSPAKYEGIIAPAEESTRKAFEGRVKDLIDGGMPAQDAEQIATMLQPPFDKSNNTLVLKRKGRPQFYKVNGDIARTIESLNPMEFGLVKAMLNTISRPIRSSVPIALDLSGIGPVSDMLITSARVPNFIPIVDNIRGAWHSAMKTPQYYDRMAALGNFGGRFEINDDFIPKTKGAAIAKEVGDVLMIAPKMIQALTRPLADAARMGEYLVRTERGGESQLAAALASRRTLGDFNRHGASLRTWALVTEFGNVGITTSGAAYQLARDAAKGLKNGNIAPATRAMTVGIAGITIPTIMFWRAAQDDDELKAKMATDKGYRYWWFRNPLADKREDGQYPISKVPIPGWWMGSVFGSSTMAMLDGMDKEAAKRLADSFIASGGFNTIPIPVQTLTGAITGTRNPFSITESRMPITPQTQKGLLPEAQGGANSSPFAMALGQKGINPNMTDFLIDRGTGGLFSSTIKAMSGGKVGGFEKSDLPIYGRFFEKDGASTQGMEAFYRDVDKAKKVDASLELFKKTGNIAGYEKVFAENEEFLMNKEALNTLGAQVSSMRRTIQQVSLDPEISKEGKREYLTEFYRTLDQLFAAYAPLRVGAPAGKTK